MSLFFSVVALMLCKVEMDRMWAGSHPSLWLFCVWKCHHSRHVKSYLCAVLSVTVIVYSAHSSSPIAGQPQRKAKHTGFIRPSCLCAIELNVRHSWYLRSACVCVWVCVGPTLCVLYGVFWHHLFVHAWMILTSFTAFNNWFRQEVRTHHNSLFSCIPFSPLSFTIEHCRAEREREAESRASALEQFLTERSLLFRQSGLLVTR